MIELKKISILDDNMKECIALEVLPEQNNFVASNAISLAQAYDENKAYAETGKGNIAVPYAVYENGIMVGFVMYGYFPPKDDEDSYCYVSYEPTNIVSKSVFALYGFEEDGRVIDGEVVAKYKL